MFATRLMILCVTAASAVALELVASDVSAQDCAVTPLQGKNVTETAEENFSCLMSKLGALETALALEKKRADQLEIKLAEKRPSPTFPKGAVVAFDRSGQSSSFTSSGACPSGWSYFEPAGGRFVLGAGSHPNEDEDGLRLTDYRSWSEDPGKAVGGAEFHTLKPAEMPKHGHSVTDPGHNHSSPVHSSVVGSDFGWNAIGGTNHVDYETTGSRASGIKVEEAGGGLPHNNMPPYVALYFCKKDTG